MQHKLSSAIIAFVLLFFIGCSKKRIPQQHTGIGPHVADSTVAAKPAKPLPNNNATTKNVRTVVPKVIVVNDAVAKKSVDGRLYYDLEGKRYWKNYKDGKYYLFNKAMYSNNAYKPN